MWHLEDVALVRSAFAIAEAERNLDDSVARTRMYRLIHRIEIADGAIRLSVASADFAFAARTAFQSASAR